jgi:membrane protein required for colicin V production
MIIDIIFVILLTIALWKGYSQGFIVAILSFLAIFIGLAAAVKFSVVVSAWMHSNTNIGTHWLPFISFLAVIILVIILVRWIAGLLQAGVEFAMLGWLNRLAGIVLYVALYTMVYSILLFYATQMGIIKTETIRTSAVYNIVEPWGRKSIDMLGNLIPVFKNMFQDLKNFFGSLASKARSK